MKNKELREYISGLSAADFKLLEIDMNSCSMQRIIQKYAALELTKKNYALLLTLFNLVQQPAHKYYWITNGIIDKYIADDVVFDDTFYKGRSAKCKGTCGYAWYNNGTDTIYINIREQEIPASYVKGSLYASTKGYHAYNDGDKTVYSKEVREDLAEGHVYSEKYKLAAASKKKTTYNNGKTEIKLLASDNIPDGFILGKLPKKTQQEKIKERDDYYDSLGYIAIKHLTKSQLNGYRYYRFIKNEITDIIYKSDAYTYINKEYLPRINEYAETNHSKGISNMELDLFDFLKAIYTGNIIRNARNIIKDNEGYYELDFFIPEKNIAIEFNGNFWHSSEVVPKNYHLIKSKLCESAGIRLIHIYEYEWENVEQRLKIESLLKIALSAQDITKIYARNCEIKEISNKEAKCFNDKNHLQGHRNAQVTYGLFYKNELVQLMSFSKTKYNKNLKEDNSWEIIRGCPGSNNVVIGGVSKLFKHFIKINNPDYIFSYCDFNKFDGRGYEAIGMKLIGNTAPDMKWLLNDNSVVNRQPSKHKVLKEAAKAQIFGAGSKKYLWYKNNN